MFMNQSYDNTNISVGTISIYQAQKINPSKHTIWIYQYHGFITTFSIDVLCNECNIQTHT